MNSNESNVTSNTNNTTDNNNQNDKVSSVNVFVSPNEVSNDTGPTDVYNKQKKLEEIKPDETITEVKGVRSAYDEPNKPTPESDPEKIAQKKQIDALKRQGEYEKLLNRIREEEKQKAAQQEQIRIEREKIAKAKIDKEKLMEEKDAKAIQEREEKLKEKQKSGSASGITSKLKAGRFDPKKELELEARKQVLEEQFRDTSKEAARMSKPLLFDYLARTPAGVMEKGSFEALSRVDVYSFLIAEGYEVYEINAAKINKVNVGGFKFKKSRLIFYLSQLSAYLKSGIALADAVKILDQQASKVDEKRAWRAVYYDLSMGDVLSVALDKRGNTFPKLLINMIKTAEMTGNLTIT